MVFVEAELGVRITTRRDIFGWPAPLGATSRAQLTWRGLFRNTSYNNSQTDLVMTVTPQIVAPLPSNGRAALPTDRGPMNFEEIKTRRVYPQDAGRPRF